MPLDPRYITSVELESYFVDKSTGEPLAGGIVSFWRDTQRTVPKLVYELIDSPPYMMANSYAPLPNPIILSQSGTFQDAAGNNIAVYYFPYDQFGNLDLYYITVTNQFGVEQFTREAWPFPATNESNITTNANISNQLSNPQFVIMNTVLPSSIITIPNAAIFHIPIAPDWVLNVTATAPTTVTVNRISQAGSANRPFNAPYTLRITPGLNITSLSLTQQLPHNPSIFSNTPGGMIGWIASSILVAPNSIVSMNYSASGGASTGTPIVLLAANNATGVYTQYNATIQLPAGDNPQNADIGFVNINIILSLNQATEIGNVQIVGLNQNESVTYEQTTVNRQVDQLFNYYNSQLQFKPINSYLVGWDFPYNPAQFLGPTLAASGAGANTSRYVWDQTIVFQTTNNGPAISRSASGNSALTITATNASQFALVQYFNSRDARKITQSRMSVNVSALTSVVAGVSGKITIYYTNDGALPSCAANNSLVLTLDATGKPATFNGNWNEIDRDFLGDAQFTIMPSPAGTVNFNDYGFMGWNPAGGVNVDNATFLAIVVGFTQLPIGQSIDFNSISLVPGDIPTRPAPKSADMHFFDCCNYYQKSFTNATVPAQNVGAGTGEFRTQCIVAGASHILWNRILFNGIMNSTAATITTYNPQAANAQARDQSATVDCSGTIFFELNEKGFEIQCVGNAATSPSNFIAIHWTADARLGV